MVPYPNVTCVQRNGVPVGINGSKIWRRPITKQDLQTGNCSLQMNQMIVMQNSKH